MLDRHHSLAGEKRHALRRWGRDSFGDDRHRPQRHQSHYGHPSSVHGLDNPTTLYVRSTLPQSPSAPPRPSFRFRPRGGILSPPSRPTNPPPPPPPPGTRQPTARDNANQVRDGAVTAAEYQQWEEREGQIQSKEAELREVVSGIPAAAEAKQRAQAILERLQRRSESLGCGRFSAPRPDNDAPPSPSRR